MASFKQEIEFTVVTCANCAIAFAVNSDFEGRRRNDHQTFYCPEGHTNYYPHKSEAEKLRDKLAERDAGIASAQAKANRLEHERDAIVKAHKRMRKRVMNGVCPCCNRTFQNLREHMQTQHADFGREQTLRGLREAFGMTQQAVAQEAFTKGVYVSLYERGKPVPVEARERLDWWLESQGAA
jgi:ssDNA-binding Zn-finger/Zn-ribbon topoisomerase 1